MESNQQSTSQNHLFNIIGDILKQVIDTSSNPIKVNTADHTVVDAILRLTETMDNLAKSVSSLCAILSCNVTTVSNKTNSGHTKSYATVASARPSQNNFPAFKSIPKATSTRINQSIVSLNDQVNQQQSPFMLRLAELKNLRNEAYFRMRRNELVSKLYEDGINYQPRRVPQKFVPNLICHRDPALLQHRNEMAVQATEQEIKTMRIHQERQAKKVIEMDGLVRSHIQTESDEVKQELLQANYDRIVVKSTASIERRIAKKIDFLGSREHMILLNEIQNKDKLTNVNLNMAVSQTVELDTSDQEMAPQENILKRKHSVAVSSTSQASEGVGSIPPRTCSSSSRIAADRHILTTSKNCILLKKKSRFKTRRQK